MNLLGKINNYWNNQDTLTRKVNRNIVFSFGVKGVGILLALLMVPITLDYLSKYEYGIWMTIFSILNWIYYFDLGLGNGLRNKLAEAIANEDMAKGRIYVSSTFAILTLLSFSLCVIALFVSNFIDWNKVLNVDNSVDNLEQIINYVLICVCINFVLKTIGVIYLSFQEAWINNFLTFLGSLVAFIWILILWKTTEPSLYKVAVAVSTSPLIVYLIAYPITFIKKYPEISPKFKSIEKAEALNLGNLGVKFFFLQVACLLIFSTSNIIISNLFSPSEVTPYNIAYKYFDVASMIFMIMINPFWSAITNAYTKNDYSWIKESINKILRLWLLTLIVLAIMVSMSQIIFKIWIGDEIEISYSLSLSIAIFVAIFLWTNIFSYYVNGVGHLNLALYTMIGAALLFIPCAIALGKKLEYAGSHIP